MEQINSSNNEIATSLPFKRCLNTVYSGGCLFWLVVLVFITEVPQSFAQTTVKGQVTSATDKTPLAGVNVVVKGTTNGISTDKNGNYQLQVKRTDAVLVFSFIGFFSQEIPVESKQIINVSLKENVSKLEDMIVIGYGVQKQETLTSSISSVSSEDFQNTPVANTDQLIQGRAAGVQVSSNSGTPGGGNFIRIRGTTSITGGSDPLYVVDGVPIQTGNFGLAIGGGETSALADIEPSNIKSIEILKDASATAIYGARASNGVVLITTKRGANSAPSVKFSSYFGVENAVKTPDLVSGPQFEMLMNEAANNNGQPKPYDNPQNAINTDWAGTVFRTGTVRNHNLTISGGNETLKYSISGSNFFKEAVVKPSAFNRSNARTNLDLKINDNLSFGSSLTYSFSNRNRARNDDNITGVLGGVYFLPSNLPVYQDDGSYTKFSIFENPVVASNEVNFNMDDNRLIGNVFGEYDFFPGLTLRSSWSYDYNEIKEDRYDNTFTNEGAAVNGSGLSSAALNNSWTIENTLRYDTSIGNNNFNALLGTSLQEFNSERTTASGQQFPSNDFHRIQDAAVQTSSSTGTKYGIASFFGRLKYDYKSKYLATVTVRRDGSSRFGANNQWGTFPSLSLGWVPSEEPFFNVKGISNLKIRGSYGITGNQSGIDNFQARGLWGGSSYTDTPGTAPQQLANPDLKWETTSQLDLGLNLGLFNDRLTVVYDYYYKKTKDLLLSVPVPMTTGFSNLVQNYGKLENKGMEFGIKADIIQQHDITWNLQFNIAGNRNKILKLAAPFNVYNRDIYRYEEGYSMYSFYLHKQLGVDPQTGAPIFKDINGDGTFDPNVDREIVGNANPDFFGGITNQVSFQNFDLSIFFQYTYGNEELNWDRFFQEHGGTRNTNFLSSQLDRWQQPGDETMVPKMTSENYAASLRPSRFLEDGSYIRLKTATLGYSIPADFLNKLGGGISHIRFYIKGQNLLTITNYSGLDPEVTATATTPLTRGIEFYTIPQAQSIIGGFDIKF